MGDLVLSTPVLRALRGAYPGAHLALMVQPANLALVKNHPAINETISFDAKGEHRSWSGMRVLAGQLRSKKFDLALILHTTNRVVLLSWMAGIRLRVGYARKMRRMLTHALPYEKRLGQKHELDYTLDLARWLGVSADDRTLEIAWAREGKPPVEKWLQSAGIGPQDQLVLIHPGASCPSKRWPAERFSETAVRLSRQLGVRLALIAGPDQMELARHVKEMSSAPIHLAPRPFSLEELPWLLQRAQCLISNDSGPVHLSSAVKTPAVAIFGRWGGGLSPARWGPTLPGSIVLHHDVGCRPCLAHRCKIGFACLDAVTVDEVVDAASQILSRKTAVPFPKVPGSQQT
ncbi:MAG: glycosyltransferase family 9 protein [Candidatus Omnitrophica bacterium]|nr:glycosyltransferase family 9 protein [Candidatus Omnitrophota bacterium]